MEDRAPEAGFELRPSYLGDLEHPVASAFTTGPSAAGIAALQHARSQPGDHWLEDVWVVDEQLARPRDVVLVRAALRRGGWRVVLEGCGLILAVAPCRPAVRMHPASLTGEYQPVGGAAHAGPGER